MKSMTGYGRGTATAQDALKAVVEISSINSKKQVEMRVSLPRELVSLESEIRGYIQKKIVRGTLNVQVSYSQTTAGAVSNIPIDENTAAAAAARLQELATSFGMPAPTLRELLLIPGVIQYNDNMADTLKPLVMDALAQAVDELDAMRVREGNSLKEDLLARGHVMCELVDKIMASEQDAIIRYRDKLVARIAKLGMELPVDDEKIAKEVVFYVDKTDITEETVRLKSHLSQYADMLNNGDDIGKNLDFLCQEMSREVNTLSAKTADMAIAESAMALKIEVSKIKEQIMNIE